MCVCVCVCTGHTVNHADSGGKLQTPVILYTQADKHTRRCFHKHKQQHKKRGGGGGWVKKNKHPHSHTQTYVSQKCTGTLKSSHSYVRVHTMHLVAFIRGVNVSYIPGLCKHMWNGETLIKGLLLSPSTEARGV